MGGAPSVNPPKAPDPGQEYNSAIGAYMGNAPQLYAEESQYQPMYNTMNQQMNLANNQAYAQQYFGVMAPVATASGIQEQQQVSGAQANLMSQYGGQATQAMYASNPAFGQIQNLANQQLSQAQTPDANLSGLYSQTVSAIPGQQAQYANIAGQVQGNTAQQNQQFQALSNQVAGDKTAQDLTQIRNQVASDPRSAIFNQTSQQVIGQLGQVDPLTGQLKDMASQQLSLGGSISAQEAQDVAQQSRAAFSARGMLNSGASVGTELLNRDQYQQQRLQQRQQFGMGVSQLADTQQQERTQNAVGLTGMDIAATQNNMQMAGQMTQAISGINQANVGLQSGLQGQIAANLAQSTQQQQSLAQAAQGSFASGIQQAAGLQGSVLDQMYRQQQAGGQNLQYLTGMSQQNLSSILGAQNQGLNAAAIPSQMNAYGTGAPNLFQSSGVLPLVNQSAMANMNAQGGAQIANAQAKSAAQGQMMAAGAAGVAAIASIAGAAIL